MQCEYVRRLCPFAFILRRCAHYVILNNLRGKCRVHSAVLFSGFLKSARSRLVFLILCWCFGAAVGTLCFFSAPDLFSSLMRSAAYHTVSIVGVLGVTLFPFLITVMVMRLSREHVVYLVCCIKALLYSLNVLSVYCAFGSAGWLFQFLIMFSENVSMFLLWILWIRYFTSTRKLPAPVVGSFLVIVLLVAVFDLCVVSPFTVSVLM